MSLANDLCGSCALCCDGSLFSYAVIDQSEKDRLGDAVNYEPSEDKILLQFPCKQLSGEGKCQVYEVRPSKCQSFQCSLLKKFEREDVTFSQTQDIVETTKEFRARARGYFRKAAPHLESVQQEGRISRAMRALKSAKKSKDSAIDPFYYKQSVLHFDLYVKLIKAHFNSGYY